MVDVNITPALPNPQQPSVGQDRAGVAAVSAASRTRDPADEPTRRQQAPRYLDPAERERLAAQAETLLQRPGDRPSHVNRALASYTAVADAGERSGLRDLLGFDAYA